MLIEASIGDAFGSAFEFAPDGIVRKYGHILKYLQTDVLDHPGRYSDDTQQSLAIAEAIIENDPWTTEFLAERFVSVFKQDPRLGYSRRLYSVLTNVSNGREFLDKIDGNSDRSGAAMRAFCIGIEPDINEVLRKYTIQAKITHNSPLGIAAAQASALMTYYFAFKCGKKSSLPEFIQTYADAPDNFDWKEPHIGKVGLKGWMSVRAAITAIVESKSMSELLVKCVEFTGDVDTVATIGLAAASFSSEIKQDLPQNLYDDLENGAFGRHYIVEVDRQLLEKWKVSIGNKAGV